ncbi:MAG: class I SAM-dependent methyltransferase [archaeon]
MKSKKTIYLDNEKREEMMADLEPHKGCYYSKNPLQKKLHWERVRNIKKLCGVIKDKKILDVGTGDGFMLRELKCKKLYAIDISKKRCMRARKIVPHANISIQDMHKTNFKDNSFDGIICADVLEHVTNIDIAIKELLRITKKGGFIVVCVPNQIVYLILRAIFLKFPLNPDHINSITPNSIIRLFKLKPIKSCNIPNFSYPFCINQLYKFTKM